MAIQILDAVSASNLSSAQYPSDVHGPDGKMLGRFIPTTIPGTSYPELGLTDEELDALVTDPNATWKTPEQVMARLQEIDQCTN